MQLSKEEIIADLVKENERLAAELDKFTRAARQRSEKISKARKRPVTIRGVTYDCAQDAADALGISLSTVKWAKQNGKLDIVGTGKKPLSQEARKKAWENNKKKIKFQGCIFNGWAEAKHVTGMSRNAMIRNGAIVI